LTFVSTVRVGNCYLMEPKSSNNGKIQKLMEGVVLEGEWERLVGLVGPVINKTDFKIQMQEGYISFATTLGSPGSGGLFSITPY
jgi:hypothetical protein